MKKRLLGLLLATVIACGSLTACGTSQETISKDTKAKPTLGDTIEEIVSGDTIEKTMSAFADYYEEFFDKHYDAEVGDWDCIGRVAYFDNQLMMIIADGVVTYDNGSSHDIYVLAYEKGEVDEKYFLKGMPFDDDGIFCHACGKGLRLGIGDPWFTDIYAVDGEIGTFCPYLNSSVNYYFSDGEIKAYIFLGSEDNPYRVEDDKLDYISAQVDKAYTYSIGTDAIHVYDANSGEEVGTFDTMDAMMDAMMPSCICESKFSCGSMDIDSWYNSDSIFGSIYYNEDFLYADPYIILLGEGTYNSDKLYHGTLTGTDFLRYLDRLAEEKSVNSEDEIREIFFEFMGVNKEDFHYVQIDEEAVKEGRRLMDEARGVYREKHEGERVIIDTDTEDEEYSFSDEM